MLEGTGYRVLTGKDGEEVIRIARQHTGPLDLLLTDVVMPELSGPQLREQLRPLYPLMKVLYMSGYPAPQSGSELPPDGLYSETVHQTETAKPPPRSAGKQANHRSRTQSSERLASLSGIDFTGARL